MRRIRGWRRRGCRFAPLLEVDGIVVRFGGVTALDRASLGAEPGQVTGVIGPNGAGKTTLFDVVSGLREPYRGRVRYGGADITRLGPHRRARAGIARTFQRLEAFGSLSVWDNVRVAVEIRQGWAASSRAVGGAAWDLLDRVGIAAFAGHRADAVPTGIARLLELARTLAIEPRLLLLDEPSSGLDDEETEALGGLLRELAAEGRAILLIEHDIELVMGVCDHVHVLDFGRVLASGGPEQIRDDRRVQEAYLGYSQEVPG
ncbi:MAG: ATP-binding cassette domain-containing protein [Streptosporangiales bacterium]|nr:ATP-binding cassette domain-containing protein [Streptosporangiales bacterium]